MPDIAIHVVSFGQSEAGQPAQAGSRIYFPGSEVIGSFESTTADILWTDDKKKINKKIIAAAIARLALDNIVVSDSDNKILIGGAV